MYVDPLDFEEFLLFDTKHQNSSYSFNSFLKFGNLPEIIEFVEIKKPVRNYEICKLYCDDNTVKCASQYAFKPSAQIIILGI